jgi:hypothetical protein
MRTRARRPDPGEEQIRNRCVACQASRFYGLGRASAHCVAGSTDFESKTVRSTDERTASSSRVYSFYALQNFGVVRFSPFVEDVHHVPRSRHETNPRLGATLGPGYRSVCRSEPNGLAERFQLVGTPANSESHYAIAPKQPEVRANSLCSVPYKGPGSPRPRSLVQTIHPLGSDGRGTSGSPKTTRRDGGASPLSLPSR